MRGPFFGCQKTEYLCYNEVEYNAKGGDSMNTLPLQTACRPRFFSLTDTKKIKGLHHEYGQAV